MTHVAGETVEPLKSLHQCLAFSSRDWAQESDLAWLWGVILGWDADPDDDPEAGDAMADIAERFGWDETQVARLRALHEAFKRLH